ncbi:MAG: DNA polymerase III subunit delta [Nitrospirota bacterium]|nr:DNA polymerase III subunit delta [Nitrospirota bacterium]
MPLLKQQELIAELEKEKIAPLYLLYGEEKFLIEETLQRIEALAVDPASRDFNLCRFDGKETSAPALLDTLQSYPFLGDKKLVVVKDFDSAPAAVLEQLEPYVANPLSCTVLVLVAEKIDRRRKFFQTFEANGVVSQFFPLFDNQVPVWVDRRVKAKGLTIDREAVTVLVETVGNDLGRLEAAIQQLATYLGERKTILASDVEAVIGDFREWSIFELTNATAEGNWERAMKILGRMMQEGEEPVMIVAMLARQFRILSKGLAMLQKGSPKESVAGSLRVPKSSWPSLFQQFRAMKEQDVKKALLTLERVDRALKSGGGNPKLILESFILRLS